MWWRRILQDAEGFWRITLPHTVVPNVFCSLAAKFNYPIFRTLLEHFLVPLLFVRSILDQIFGISHFWSNTLRPFVTMLLNLSTHPSDISLFSRFL